MAVSDALGDDVKPRTPEDFRALYLYNFARYTEWGSEDDLTGTNTFRIGVLGSEPMAQAAERMLAKQFIRQRKLQIVRLPPYKPDNDSSQFDKLHVLFIGAGENRNLDEILNALQTRSVLTVMEIDEREFEASQGMVNFVIDRNKLNFVINQAAGEKARLKFDPRLLNLAKKVYKAHTATPAGSTGAGHTVPPRGWFVKSVP